MRFAKLVNMKILIEYKKTLTVSRSSIPFLQSHTQRWFEAVGATSARRLDVIVEMTSCNCAVQATEKKGVDA